MQKLTALILSVLLALTLTACNTASEESSVDTSSAIAEVTSAVSQETSTPPQESSTLEEADLSSYQAEPPGEGAASASNITSVEGVPLITLNNGVQMPQFGLGTQIQSLENGDLGVLNQTSREAVAAALKSGYRHLDDAHGYLQERGVGRG